MTTRVPSTVAFASAACVFLATLSGATNLVVVDGDTVKLGSTTYRLDGVDAPEPDQLCLGENGKFWRCGTEVRDRLSQYIGGRSAHCDDKGADRVHPGRRVAICTVDGETISINQWLVREGLALNFEPYARGRFQRDEGDARQNLRGLWKGCFVAPQDLRYWRKRTAPLLGSSCPDETVARDALFPDHVDMPPGCPIKGAFALRARLTLHRGIYHLEGCRSYRTVKIVNRWFCSEEDAVAAGFRKALNCWL
jgi:endonuclease YncB( thermonuclease family)